MSDPQLSQWQILLLILGLYLFGYSFPFLMLRLGKWLLKKWKELNDDYS